MADEIMAPEQPSLPTYKTAAQVLELDKGSGLRLLGWTFARTAMIMPPFLIVGVPWKRALAGSIFASSLISLFTLVRIYNARTTNLEGVQKPKGFPALPAARRR